ncbi:hypothetical protein [Marinobacter sp.]|uniref:hypothetical protein n=1 Tax=Marinobacter sp. TaxID=50741 RepID=UPI001B596D95|nr:hypothetical protein [Marinobacter sp.]MBQ0831292.1 hypothetical protein [Marinobacter sp.]
MKLDEQTFLTKANPNVLKSFLIVAFITIFGLSGIRDYLTPAWYWVLGCSPFLVLGGLELRLRGFRGLVEELKGNSWVMWVALYWLIFIAGIAVAGIANAGVGLGAALKYAALLLVFLALSTLHINTQQVLVGLKAWAAFALCGVAGLFLFDATDYLIITPGRIGWALAFPGVLWKAGVFLLLWSIWQLLMRPLNIGGLVWLFISALVMGFDGSRTGILIAAGAFLVFLVLALIRHRSCASVVLGRAVVLGLFIVVGMGAVNPSPWNPIRWAPSISQSVVKTDVPTREIAEDPVRLRMFKEAVSGSLGNFPLGAGFGSTGVSVAGVEGLMVVHITYLQLLSDVGVIGLIGYLGIFAIPLLAAYRRVARAENGWLVLDRFSLPLCILSGYLVAGLFHPVSSELSEWAIVLLALCLLVKDRPESECGRGVRCG